MAHAMVKDDQPMCIAQVLAQLSELIAVLLRIPEPTTAAALKRILQRILNYISDFVDIILGSSHPLRHICIFLAKFESPALQQWLMLRSLHRIVDCSSVAVEDGF